MRRREFMLALGGAAAWPLAARAQGDRVRRVGVLMPADENDPVAKMGNGFLEQLKSLAERFHTYGVRQPCHVSARTRVAVLSNPGNPAHVRGVDTVKGVARSLGLELLLQEARGPDEFDSAFAAMARDRAGALLVVADSMFYEHQVRLVELALRGQLPSWHGSREEVEAGGFMSYAIDLAAQFRQAASYVDKILRGAKPADLPVEQPTKFELVINLRTAKALGITVPPTLLGRADEVIE